MRSPNLGPLLLIVCALFGLTMPAAQTRKNKEPKPQILPLPPEPPMAIAGDTNALDFHISPLLKIGGLSAQIRQSLNDLIRDTHGETILKLRAFVAGTGDARRVQADVAEIFTERKLPLPVLTILQVGALGEERAEVVIEAVVSTPRIVNPNGLAFFFGQHGPTLAEALRHLKQSTAETGVASDRVLTCTCFTSRIDDFEASSRAVRALFSNAAVNIVQAVRDPANDASMCEATAQLGAPPPGPVVHVPSANASLVNSPRLVFTGLQLSFGDYLDDGHQAFARLKRRAAAIAPVETPVIVNAFTLEPSASAALRKTNSLAPGTFSIQTVEGLPAIDASGGIEAILAPDVESATVQKAKGPDATIHPE